jgi:rhodanese-related sulfurtransferase
MSALTMSWTTTATTNGTTTATTTAAGLVAEAKRRIRNLSPAQAAAEVAAGALLVDLRESGQRAEHGVIPGAVHAPRGMLEFHADSASPYHKPEFDPARRVVLHCASGGRSALAVLTLRELGYAEVAHLDGGLKAWKESGNPVDYPAVTVA